MKVRKLSIDDASFERSPGQDGDIFTGNIIDERHGGAITIGYSRYAPDQTLSETIAVDDVIIVLEGRISVTTDADTVQGEPGEIIYLPKGETVTIRTRTEGAVTAYVTYPHWREARD